MKRGEADAERSGMRSWSQRVLWERFSARHVGVGNSDQSEPVYVGESAYSEYIRVMSAASVPTE